MDTTLIIKVESQGAKKAEAELAALDKQGAKTEKSTESLGKTSKETGKGLDDLSKATAQSGETAEQAAARIHKMVTESLARKAAMEQALTSERATTAATIENAAALDTATASHVALQGNVLALGAAFGELDGIMAGTAKTAEDIAAQEAALDQLMAAGAISAEEQAAALAALTAREEKLGLATAVTTAAMEGQTEAAIGLKLASGGAVREYTALLDEVISGRTGRTPGTLAVLGSRIGLTQKLFSATGLAVLGTTAAVGAFIDVIAKGEAEESEFNRIVQLTGGYLGVTRGQLRGMADDMAGDIATFGEARDALLAVAQTGRFTGDQIKQIGTAALAMSKVTGKSVQDAVNEFVKLGDSPVDAVIKLDQQYHFLTAAVFDQIQALEDEGRTRQAGEIAQAAAAKAFDQRAQDMEDHLGLLQRAWRGLESAASSAWDAILSVGRDNTIQEQINAIDQKIKDIRGSGFAANAGLSQQIPALEAEKAFLESQLKASQQAAKSAAEQKQANTAYVAASHDIDGMLQSLDKASKKQAELNRLTADFKDIAAAPGGAAKLEQLGVTQTATGFSGGAYDKLYNEIESKYAVHQTKLGTISTQTDLERFNSGLQRASDHYADMAAMRAKDLADLEASLQTASEATNASYAKRYNDILRLTQDDPAKQKDLLGKLFQQYGNKTTSGLEHGGPQSFGDKEQSVNDEYERQRAAVLANTKLTQDQRTALELRLTKDRNARIAALENQRNVMQLGASAQLFDGLAGIAATFGSKESGAYKALFAISKGFSIAQAVMAIQTGVAQALASGPPPINFIAAAAVAAKGATTLATIRGAQFSGAYDAGGYIPSGKYGLVGEIGPELVSGPAHVTSRADTAKALSRAPIPHITITNDARGAGPDQIAALLALQARTKKEIYAAVLFYHKHGYFPQ